MFFKDLNPFGSELPKSLHSEIGLADATEIYQEYTQMSFIIEVHLLTDLWNQLRL